MQVFFSGETVLFFGDSSSENVLTKIKFLVQMNLNFCTTNKDCWIYLFRMKVQQKRDISKTKIYEKIFYNFLFYKMEINIKSTEHPSVMENK